MNNNSFIKLPNEICALRDLPCRAYLYLTYLCTVQQSDTVKVKQETIRQHIGAAFLPAVNRVMHKLEELKLISITNNFNSETGCYMCSSYKVNNFNPQKDYFLLPAEYATVDMPPVAYQLMLTLYMYSFNDSYSFPSYSEIKKITGMSSASISKSIRILEEKGIIKKENYIKKDGSKGHNRYFIVKKLQRIMQSDKAEKLLQWIRRQKQVCFEIWQIIKEVIRGNALLLEEICTLADNDGEGNSDSGSSEEYTEENEVIEQDEDLYSAPKGLIACHYSDKDYIIKPYKPNKRVIFDKVKKKIGCIGVKIKEGFCSLFYNLKRYFL